MIICFYFEQTQYLFNLKTFEMNMIFKRNKIKNINEMMFTTYVLKLSKNNVIIFCYQTFINVLNNYDIYSSVC